MSTLEEEFEESWSRMVRFYEFFADGKATSGADVAKGMLPLTNELTASDAAKEFRAGQSLTTLVISRAREHGLRPEEQFVSVFFDPTRDEYQLTFFREGENGRAQKYSAKATSVKSQLVELLKVLKMVAPDPAA